MKFDQSSREALLERIAQLEAQLAEARQGEQRFRCGAEQERLRLLSRVRKAQKLESLGLMAAGVAHDFNNLLLGVLGNASLARQSLPEDASVHRQLKKIERAARRASELTRQLLDFSGGAKKSLSRIDLEPLVDEAAALAHEKIGEQVKLHKKFSGSLPKVEADPSQIRQVVMNLLINAAEACSDGSIQLTVRTQLLHAEREFLSNAYLDDRLPAGDYVSVEVIDKGCGMDEETQARIFDPFFTTKIDGRGLGLAVVQGIVRAHQGAIRLKSSPGEGTTFELLLPVAQAKE